mmetsp:Transcript_35853/g.34902  ORF Transcript_35853/g.34902 Transcript_35853/m.34902 type:complete len:145 (+) Transcript_35853:509-943(+)
MSTAPLTNGALATLYTHIYIVDDLTVGGLIEFVFPRQTQYYVGSGLGASSDSMIPSCTSGSCSPTLSIVVNYDGDGSDYYDSYAAAYGGTTDTLTITTNVGAGGLEAGGTITVTVDSIYNPPSARAFSGIQVTTQESDTTAINN